MLTEGRAIGRRERCQEQREYNDRGKHVDTASTSFKLRIEEQNRSRHETKRGKRIVYNEIILTTYLDFAHL